MATPAPPRSLIDLPELAVDEILCRLPIIDAVRTSILSHSWRHRWKSIPDLNNLSAVAVSVISRLLRLHYGSIRLFRAQTAGSPAVHGWISTLSRRSAHSLRTLDLSMYLFPIARSSPHLDCLKLSQFNTQFFPHLSHLKFCQFNICAKAAARFAFLKELHLHGCRLQGSLSVLISACPTLERLILTDVELEGQGQGQGPQRVDIVSPNLRHIESFQVFGVLDFSISSAPVLQTAVMDFWVVGDGNLMEVFKGMANIEKLELAFSTLQVLQA